MTTPSGPPSDARTLAPGRGAGEAVVLVEPLSLWGGMDPATGELIDPHHPQAGVGLRARVVAMPGGRGSSSSSSVLAESIRAGTGPAAFVLLESDPILAVGSVVADELYGRGIPVVVAPPQLYGAIEPGDRVSVTADPDGARVEVTPRGSRQPAPG